jgi:hypothetical protein
MKLNYGDNDLIWFVHIQFVESRDLNYTVTLNIKWYQMVPLEAYASTLPYRSPVGSWIVQLFERDEPQ